MRRREWWEWDEGMIRRAEKTKGGKDEFLAEKQLVRTVRERRIARGKRDEKKIGKRKEERRKKMGAEEEGRDGAGENYWKSEERR